MTQHMLTQALHRAKDTREVVIAPGALQQADAVLARCFGGQAVALVADDNTYAAAGAALANLLAAAGRPVLVTHVFPGRPRLHPESEHVDLLVQVLGALDAVPVAVGSGVINDLTKLAAHRLGRAYAVVGTAASMDGYTAYAAAITHSGVKKVDPCPAPRALIADLDVIAAAPPGMSASGYGDLLGKYTALADWRIAQDIGIDAIEPVSWQLMESGLAEWTQRPEGIGGGDPAVLRDLVEGLVLAGLAMQISGSTRPASGSEHLFSHLWEMQGLTHDGESVPHGIQVGLGMLAASALLDWLRMQDLSRLPVEALARSWPGREAAEADVRRLHPAGAQADQAVAETLAKHLSASELKARLERIQAVWPDLRAWLGSWCLAPEEVRRRLTEAGCATDPRAVSLTFPRLQQAYGLARQVRSRYTVLDLAAETGLLQPGVAALFEPGGFWGKQARGAPTSEGT